jgi:DNA-directed RNA polymerase subunit K/omega
MGIKPIDLEYFNEEGKNVHESIVAASKRARQLNEDLKIEFNQRIEMFATKTETEAEEMDVNPDQLKVSLEFEKRPKPTDVALEELMNGTLAWHFDVKEVPEPAKADEETAESEE